MAAFECYALPSNSVHKRAAGCLNEGFQQKLGTVMGICGVKLFRDALPKNQMRKLVLMLSSSMRLPMTAVHLNRDLILSLVRYTLVLILASRGRSMEPT